MSILHLPHSRPDIILIDWHATLVDTRDAMYHAVDEVLPLLHEVGLLAQTVHPDDAKTLEDARLILYVREHHRLHPKIVGQRKISRTDIFEVLFGPNQDAKKMAHRHFDDAYRKFMGEVAPLEPDTREQLERLRTLGLRLGVITNRNREFMTHELNAVENGSWQDLFDSMSCGNDVEHRKPAPDLLFHALAQMQHAGGKHCWYVGDSTTDVIAAHKAGATAVFYNGARWDQAWLDKIFPGTAHHPYQPEAVVHSMQELVELARLMIANDKRVDRAK